MTSSSNSALLQDAAEIKLSHRSVKGKNVAKLRKTGIMPVHLYGGDGEPLSLQVSSAEIYKLLPRVGLNIPVSVTVEGGGSSEICFVREVQRQPITQDIMHVDFMRVDVKSKITAKVPVEVIGNPPAVRLLGGTLIQNMQSITVESLPLRVPERITVDVSSIEDFETAIHVSDITVDDDITITDLADSLIARVAPPRVEIEEVEEVDEEAPVEGEEIEETEGESETGRPEEQAG